MIFQLEKKNKTAVTKESLIERNVPPKVAYTLAPFQREGVDFVIRKNGRAFIGDEMGLGKTIQAIASMAAYSHEWPVLVVTPSSARYHWDAEFLQVSSRVGANDGFGMIYHLPRLLRLPRAARSAASAA